MNGDNMRHFDSFGVEHVPKEIKTFTGDDNIKTNIYRIQAYDSIMSNNFVLALLILCWKVKVC